MDLAATLEQRSRALAAEIAYAEQQQITDPHDPRLHSVFLLGKRFAVNSGNFDEVERMFDAVDLPLPMHTYRIHATVPVHVPVSRTVLGLSAEHVQRNRYWRPTTEEVRNALLETANASELRYDQVDYRQSRTEFVRND